VRPNLGSECKKGRDVTNGVLPNSTASMLVARDVARIGNIPLIC
jgi:hypothetical protein